MKATEPANKNYFKKSFSTGAVNVGGSALITGISIPILVQNIGIDIYGQWSLLYFFLGFSNLLDFGISKALVYLIPKQDDKREINKIYSAGFILNNILIVILLLACLLINSMDINIWQTREAFSAETGHKLFIFGILLSCISFMGQFYGSLLEAFYKIHIVNLGFLLLTMLTYIPLLILSFFTKKIEFLILFTLTANFLVLLFQIAVVKRSCHVNLVIPSLDTFRKIFSCSFQFLSIGILIAVVLPINRYLLINFSDNSGIYGSFDIAYKISLMANSCLAIFATPMLTVFSGFGRERLSEITHILSRALKWLGGAYVLGSVIFFLSGRTIIKFMFETESPDIYTSSMILILGICLTGVAEPFYRAFLGIGEMKTPTLIKILLFILNIIFIITLYKLSPLYRVSISISLAYGITAIITILKFKQIPVKS